MYIKTIVLEGFKSYGTRTEITGFDKRFNAITGLNGSGKSNVLDSICFVLGITNLTHVRAGNLQDLIYKCGQAGVNKATVSITFDNSCEAQCPPGFEGCREIIVTRQIALGGKNKYFINGVNVPNKKVTDLFCSIQLNVNNPHFLIMQGKITKVLNMKPIDILSMIEEAAGTKMYEVKRQLAEKTIQKKDEKLHDFDAILTEELAPRLNKLREEREVYLEYQRIERELEHMINLYQAWLYFASKKQAASSERALQEGEEVINSIQNKIEGNKEAVAQIDEQIEEITRKTKSEASEKLQALEAELKEKEKSEAKSNTAVKSIENNISGEKKKLTTLEKNVNDEEKALKSKEQELEKLQSLFENLKKAESEDKEAFVLSQKKFEAISAGMEVNEEGQVATLQEQLMAAERESAEADTASKEASMQLVFNQKRLQLAQKDIGLNTSDHMHDQTKMEKLEKEVANIEVAMNKLNYSEERMQDLEDKQRTIQQNSRAVRDRVTRFETYKPHTQFRYQDPEPNFNKRSVKGVVCRLFKVRENRYCTALEIAAGGRLFNVVVDTEVTGKKLMQRGNLQQRTTFIPLNKIQARSMDQRVVNLAAGLVGEDNVHSALSLISFDKQLTPAMEYIFGNVLICKDLRVAKEVAFHNKILKRCVTLDGDVVDPSGTLTGGSRDKGNNLLLDLQEILVHEEELNAKDAELSKIEAEIRRLSGPREQYESLKKRLELGRHELNLLKQRLKQTTHHRQQEEVNNLKANIEELQQKIISCKEVMAKCNQKVKELKTKINDSKGHKDRELKKAENEMKQLKQKAEKSRKAWEQREQDYQTLLLEISELQKTLESSKGQIVAANENLAKWEQDLVEKMDASEALKEEVKALQKQLKMEKQAIAEKSKEIQKSTAKKEKLLAQNSELELQIKAHTLELKKLQDDCKHSKAREHEYEKKIKKDSKYLKEAQQLSDKDGHDLERRVKTAQERKTKLKRTVNTKAQSMFEQEEKQCNDLKKKQMIVENDKKKLLVTIEKLDQQKKAALNLAFDQVSKDFGSIFNTLLPGSNAKLVAPPGKTILEGIEIKVSLGGVWKESLTELSGGQRSLAALSLILAMLLFKPAPLYILDEVDAALDLSHTQNIGSMLKTHFKQSQFIIVSLKDGMFNNANVLFKTKFIDGVSTISRTVNTHAH